VTSRAGSSLALALIGATFFGIALARFRKTIGTMARASSRVASRGMGKAAV
jgi:hypothetical protein